MTLNGVMAVIWRYFSEFAYLPGVLRKSSRSLSHLMTSSCKFLGTPVISFEGLKLESSYFVHERVYQVLALG